LCLDKDNAIKKIVQEIHDFCVVGKFQPSENYQIILQYTLDLAASHEEHLF